MDNIVTSFCCAFTVEQEASKNIRFESETSTGFSVTLAAKISEVNF